MRIKNKTKDRHGNILMPLSTGVKSDSLGKDYIRSMRNIYRTSIDHIYKSERFSNVKNLHSL